jgi:hypothetical protein
MPARTGRRIGTSVILASRRFRSRNVMALLCAAINLAKVAPRPVPRRSGALIFQPTDNPLAAFAVPVGKESARQGRIVDRRDLDHGRRPEGTQRAQEAGGARHSLQAEYYRRRRHGARESSAGRADLPVSPAIDGPQSSISLCNARHAPSACPTCHELGFPGSPVKSRVILETRRSSRHACALRSQSTAVSDRSTRGDLVHPIGRGRRLQRGRQFGDACNEARCTDLLGRASERVCRSAPAQ